MHQLQSDMIGKVVMFFPKDSSMGLVKRLLGKDANDFLISELDEEVLIDLSDVFLSNVLGTFSDTIDTQVEVSMPKVRQGLLKDLFKEWFEPTEAIKEGLFLSLGFRMNDYDLEGRSMFYLTLNSMDVFLGKIRSKLERDGLI